MKKLIITAALALASLAAQAQSSEALLMCMAAERAYGPNSPVTARICETAYVPQRRQYLPPPEQPQQPSYTQREVVTKCERNESTRVVRCVTR